MATYAVLQTPFEFEDRSGITRSLYGCSVAGRFEFFERLQEIEAHLKDLDQTRSWQELYDSDRRLRFLCDRCLELNHVSPDWVTPVMVEQLLFHRPDPETDGWQEGWLITINRPSKPAPRHAEPMGMEEILAAVSTHCQSLQEAIALTDPETGLPANLLLTVLEARNKLAELSDPEKRQKAKVRDGKKRAARKFQEMQERQQATAAAGAGGE